MSATGPGLRSDRAAGDGSGAIQTNKVGSHLADAASRSGIAHLAGDAARYGVTVDALRRGESDAAKAGVPLDEWMARLRAQQLQKTAADERRAPPSATARAQSDDTMPINDQGDSNSRAPSEPRAAEQLSLELFTTEQLEADAAHYRVDPDYFARQLAYAAEDGVPIDEWMWRRHPHLYAELGMPTAASSERAANAIHRRESAERRRNQRAEATHRRGRSSEQKRNRVIAIRVNDREYEALSGKAYQQQLSLSAYLVQSGMNRRITNPKRGPKPPPSVEPIRADVCTGRDERGN